MTGVLVRAYGAPIRTRRPCRARALGAAARPRSRVARPRRGEAGQAVADRRTVGATTGAGCVRQGASYVQSYSGWGWSLAVPSGRVAPAPGAPSPLAPPAPPWRRVARPGVPWGAGVAAGGCWGRGRLLCWGPGGTRGGTGRVSVGLPASARSTGRGRAGWTRRGARVCRRGDWWGRALNGEEVPRRFTAARAPSTG